MVQEKTPLDEITGMPLLLVRQPKVLPLVYHPALNAECRRNNEPYADLNHVYHPSKVVIGLGAGAIALRNSRGQMVMREDHNRYHDQYSGPVLPKTPLERFKACVLSAAGYIPALAIDVRRDSPRIVELTPADRERMHSSGEVRMVSTSSVNSFLKDFVMRQSVDHILDSKIDRFLALDPRIGPESEEQRYLSHLLLSLVIDRVEEHLEIPYSQAHQLALLKPGAPRRPGDFIRQSIMRSKNMRKITHELRKKLSAHREGLTPSVA